MAPSNITLASVEPSDYLAIARLMGAAFAHEEFGVVAFGPERNSDAAISYRARTFAKAPHAGETNQYMKAMMSHPDGREEVVGYAGWTTCIGRTGSEEEMVRLGTKEGWAQEEREKAEKEERLKEGKQCEGDEDMFGPDSKHGNAKLREDSFGKGDEYQAMLSEGRDYLMLNTLVVHPEYWRRGIGALLFEEGLKRADEAGLQTVLGASSHGLGLYKKYGCVEGKVVDLKLWEYEGGEGLGVTRHVFLRRPAVSR